ncbi:MAG: hypothetical protein WD066_15165 [Planctomycetaceae bacterium]
MGIDFLDIRFRLEKRFEVRLDRHSETALLATFEAASPEERDFTAGALHDWICEECRRAGRPVPTSSWTRVKLTLAEVLLIAPHEIRRDSRLVRDLGMS